jgi:hypothetical protein
LRTKTKSPQTNGIWERFHKTALKEFYRVAFRKKVYRSIDELQADLDAYVPLSPLRWPTVRKSGLSCPSYAMNANRPLQATTGRLRGMSKTVCGAALTTSIF